jgi:lipopolysaccharide assembly outer membrane protein LptD (OstA)
MGVAHADDAGWDWHLRGEVRIERSSDSNKDRDTFLLSSGSTYKVNPDWRFKSSLDALISNSDQSTLLDGEYVEASLGYAYRPVDNERMNALFKYTYLYDLAGPDQLAFDGSSGADKQRSHILSMDVNYDLNKRWTIGGKYGLRIGETAPRGTSTFTASTTQLAVLRADYHMTSEWDAMVEARAISDKEIETVDTGVVAAVYRHLGKNAKIGVGFDSGSFSDDLRQLTYDRQGLFLNLVGKF